MRLRFRAGKTCLWCEGIRQELGANSGIPRFNLNRLPPLLEDVHERMAGVIIEQLPWDQVISRYDRDGMLFYLDPPYWGNENDYGKGLFDRDQFAEMAEQLGRIKGSFLLSINDRPEIREMFGSFNFHEVGLKYTVGRNEGKEARELIIND